MYVLRKKVHILPKNKQLIIKQFEFETSHKNGNPQESKFVSCIDLTKPKWSLKKFLHF